MPLPAGPPTGLAGKLPAAAAKQHRSNRSGAVGRSRGPQSPGKFPTKPVGLTTKPYEFMRFGAMDATKPYEFIGFGAMGRSRGPQSPGVGPD